MLNLKIIKNFRSEDFSKINFFIKCKKIKKTYSIVIIPIDYYNNSFKKLIPPLTNIINRISYLVKILMKLNR